MQTTKLSAKTVTVAIACYNQGRFLADAIGSILSQSRSVNEIILVDDGSSDDTAVVAARFPNVLYVYQDNGGLSSARNTALRISKGARILFLDADDLLTPNAIADGLDCFDANPDVAFVYGGYREVNENRQLIYETHAKTYVDGFTGLLRGNHISMHGTVIYDAEVLRRSGGFDVNLPSCEDYDVYLRLARSYQIAAYSSIGADYRRHGDNMTRNHIRMMKLSRLVLQRHICAGPLSKEQSAAARVGLEEMTGFYARNALREVSISMRRVGHLLWGGLRNDPRFILRIFGYSTVLIARRLRRSLGATNTEYEEG